MTKGPTYFTATFLELVLNCVVNGEIKYTKSPVLYWKYSLSLFIRAIHFILKFCSYFEDILTSLLTMCGNSYMNKKLLYLGLFLSLTVSLVLS